MKILGTGLSGLVGSRVVELLASHFSFQSIEYQDTDITDKRALEEVVYSSDASWMFHFAAKTDVDGCEIEKELGEKSEAWRVNVLATKYIVDACLKSNKKLLYISTDYVFDGNDISYDEASLPKPLSWYGKTKLEGEWLVSALPDSIIIRIANPYKAYNTQKIDFVHKIIRSLSMNQEIRSPADRRFIPTYIDDIAEAILTLVQLGSSGLYHVVGSQAVTSEEAIRKIAKFFGYSNIRITSIPYQDYFSGRAPRPFHAVLKNDKIQKLGVHMSSLDEGLKQIDQQNPGLKFRTI